MTNMRRTLVAVASGLLASLVLLAPRSAPANHGHYWDPVCINVADHGSTLFTMRVIHEYMLEPDPDELRTVKAIVNGTQPALGVAMRTGSHTAALNVQGNVAGFFTAMTFNWNNQTNTGSGRVIGELSAHQSVTLTTVTCH